MKWQDWVDKAPKDMSSVVFLRKQPQTRLFFVQVRGLTISQDRLVKRGLTRVTRELNPRVRPVLQKRNFLQTFEWFSGEEDFSPTYEKGKSDIVKAAWNSRQVQFLLNQLPASVDVEITALGGAMHEIPWDQTAFPHRDGSKLLIQWGVSWTRSEQSRRLLNELNDFFVKIRPIMSSAAFLNYADRDLPNPAKAYWGSNLDRLIEVKRKYDPHNIFRHALSVPLQLDVPIPKASNCS